MRGNAWFSILKRERSGPSNRIGCMGERGASFIKIAIVAKRWAFGEMQSQGIEQVSVDVAY